MKKKYEAGMDADDAHDPYESTSDAAANGFRKIAFGADDKVNYLVQGAYVKQATPKDSENTKIKDICRHEVHGKMYSDKDGEKDEAEYEIE